MKRSYKFYLFSLILIHLPFFVTLSKANTLEFEKQNLSFKADSPKLMFTTNRINLTYCSQSEALLELELILSNPFKVPILYYKNSKTLVQYTITKIEKNKEKNKEHKYNLFLDLMKVYKFKEQPKEDDFVSIKTNKPYKYKDSIIIDLFDKNDEFSEGLTYGIYTLEIWLITWYYSPYIVESYRQKWQDKGYLWTENIKSSPMFFEIKPFQITPCVSTPKINWLSR